MKIDYSSLYVPVTKTDITSYRAAKTKNRGLSALNDNPLLGLAAILFVLIVFTSILAKVTGASLGNIFYLGGPITILSLIGYFWATYSSRQSDYYAARLYRFATANDIKFIEAVPNPPYEGAIFSRSLAPTLTESYILPNDIQIGNVEYTSGSGNYRILHQWGFVRTSTSRRLPHMILDAKSNDYFGLSDLPEKMRGRILSLEGNFGDYFTLYVPKEYERDALYILTPNIMATLIDKNLPFDIEVIDDSLIIFTRGKLRLGSEEEIVGLLETAETVKQAIARQADRYSDDRVSSRDLNVVAEAGRRLI